MRLDSETLTLLGDSARRYGADQYGFQARRSIMKEPLGFSPKAWDDYGELGWLSLKVPESHGGLDGDDAAVGVIMEVVGSHLLMEPILTSAFVSTELIAGLGSTAQQEALLPDMAGGALKVAFACNDDTGTEAVCRFRGGRLQGRKISVLHGSAADYLLVTARDDEQGGEPGLFLVDARCAQATRNSYSLVDGRDACNIHFDGAPAERLGDGKSADISPVLGKALAGANAALCAETLGIVKALVAKTCEYLKTRKQFGRPIGDNQALQHRAVDMFLQMNEIDALTRTAQRAMDQEARERDRIVSGAKAYITSAARRIANEAVQMHGGLGITEELEISHYFRRLMVNAVLFGSRDEHFTRFVDATL